MKYKFLYCFVLVITLIACDDNFSPLGEFKNEYVLTCILHNDSNLQTATLTHNYLPPGNDPSAFNVDPFIKRADIRVWYNDSVYVFRDTSIIRTDTSRYSGEFNFYYNDQFILNTSEPIEIEVLLNTGHRLRAESVSASDITFLPNSEVLIPPVNSGLIQFSWEPQEIGTYFSSNMIIDYIQSENGVNVEKSVRVPAKYINQNGELIPVYPEASMRTNAVYTLDAVIKTLESISDGDPNKENYFINQALSLNFMAYDLQLSKYASSVSEALNDLTVTLNSADFTNIDGGLGIFGSYIVQNYPNLRFQPEFIESFGYNIIYSAN